MAMESYNLEIESEQARRWYFIKRACLIIPFALAAIILSIFYRQIQLPGNNLEFSLSTCAVALVLAGTYYYAYKFFTEHFYFCIFVSWLANAVYLVLDLNGPAVSVPEYQAYKIWIFILSLVPSAYLLLALLSVAERPARIKRTILYTTVAGIVGLLVSYFFITKLGNLEHRTLATWMLPGSTLSFGLLCITGVVLNHRLRYDEPGVKGYILLYTFFTYAVLQFLYPFTPYLQAEWPHWLLFIFVIAQLAKVGNAIAMTGVLQSAITNRDRIRQEEIKEAQHEVTIKNAELEAQQASLKLEEANVEKRKQFIELGVLASSIKHDVSTPLATMGFEIGVLKDRYQHDKKFTKKLDSLEYSMERIHAILQVVDIFRGDQVFFDRDQYMSKVNLLEVVHRAVRSIKNEKKELKLVNARNKIVVDGRDVWVRAYAPMFEQVIVNIIKNGLEAIEEAKRERGLIKINVSAPESSTGDYARCAKVEIEDNGIGIPEEHICKLTTLFTTRGEKKANSGIGLFIGKKIVDIHNGKIEFESTVGKGTKVTLLLPEWNALHRTEQPEANGASRGTGVELDSDLVAEATGTDEKELVREETYE